jgi:hypothetical protein
MNLKELAEECGIGYLMDPADEFFVGDALSNLAKKIAAEEREACAMVCEHLRDNAMLTAGGRELADVFADAIRRRSDVDETEIQQGISIGETLD